MNFWDVKMCSLVERCQHLRATCCLQLQIETEPADCSDNVGTSLPAYVVLHSRICALNIHWCETLKSYISLFLLFCIIYYCKGEGEAKISYCEVGRKHKLTHFSNPFLYIIVISKGVAMLRVSCVVKSQFLFLVGTT